MSLARPCTYSAHEDGNGCSASNLEAQLCGCGKGLFHDACVMLRTAADVGMQCTSCLQRCLSQRAAACLPLQNRQPDYDTGNLEHPGDAASADRRVSCEDELSLGRCSSPASDSEQSPAEGIETRRKKRRQHPANPAPARKRRANGTWWQNFSNNGQRTCPQCNKKVGPRTLCCYHSSAEGAEKCGFSFKGSNDELQSCRLDMEDPIPANISLGRLVKHSQPSSMHWRSLS